MSLTVAPLERVADGSNNGKNRSTVTRPEGTQLITYSNYLGQAMLTDLVSGGDHWIDYHSSTTTIRRCCNV
jgi:hypothetical protein